MAEENPPDLGPTGHGESPEHFGHQQPDPETRYSWAARPLDQPAPPPLHPSPNPSLPPPGSAPLNDAEHPFTVNQQPQGAWGFEPAAPPASAPAQFGAERQRRGWSGLRIGLVVTAVVVVCVAAVGVLYVQLTTSLVDDGVPESAEIGECFGTSANQGAISCDGPHRFEVFSAIIYDEAPYHDRITRALVHPICEEDFEIYTGQNFYTSAYDVAERYPSEESWDSGNRLTLCVLFHSEGRVMNSRVGDIDAIYNS